MRGDFFMGPEGALAPSREKGKMPAAHTFPSGKGGRENGASGGRGGEGRADFGAGCRRPDDGPLRKAEKNATHPSYWEARGGRK